MSYFTQTYFGRAKRETIFQKVTRLFNQNKLSTYFKRVYPFAANPQCCDEITDTCCNAAPVEP